MTPFENLEALANRLTQSGRLGHDKQATSAAQTIRSSLRDLRRILTAHLPPGSPKLAATGASMELAQHGDD